MSSKGKIAVVDIETTGANYQKDDKIIQIAAVIYQEGQVLNEYNMLINPERDIPEPIQRLTGIDQAQANKAPNFQQVANLWFHRLQDCLFVAHNLNFDYNFLQYSFQQEGYQFEPKAIDTVVLAKILCYDAAGFNLTDLSHYFELNFSGAHDALADARITCQILGKMVPIVEHMSANLKESLLPLVRALPYDNHLFLEDAEDFYFPLDSTMIVATKSADRPLTKNQSQDLLEILEAYQDHPHLLVEDDAIPLKPSTIYQLGQYLAKRGDKVLIAVSHIDQTKSFLTEFDHLLPNLRYQVLSPQWQFIEPTVLHSIIQRQSSLHFNQHELIVLAASLHWLSQTKSGHYQEINQELQADQVLAKYRLDSDQMTSNPFYQQMKEASKQAQILLIDHAYLIQLLQQPTSFLSRMIQPDWHLLLDNLDYYIQTKRWQESQVLNLSRLFDIVNRQLDRGRSRGLAYKDLLDWQNFLQATSQLMAWLEEQFKADQPNPSSKQINLSFYLDPRHPLWIDINDRLSHWLKLGKGCANSMEGILLTNQPDLELEQEFRNIQAFQVNQPASYIELKAHQFHTYYFHFEIHQVPLKFLSQKRIEPYCFQHSILLSLGGLMGERADLLQQVLPLKQHTVLRLTSQSQDPPLIGQIPLDYCTEQEDASRNPLIAAYLEDHLSELKDKIIIMAEHKEACAELLTVLLKNDLIYQKYHLLSESLSGSVHKIYRRFLEADRAILIMTFSQLQTVKSEVELRPINLLLVRLPFLSPQHTYIQAMDYLLEENPAKLFEKIDYPQMIQDFKEMLTYMREFYIFKEVTIFDQRIFTKVYAHRLSQDLKALIQFERV